MLSLGRGNVVTLTANAVFTPQCTGSYVPDFNSNDPSSVADLRDPFYASTTPQTYVIAATTVLAWVLVVMLIITPRTFFMGSVTGSPSFSTGRGIIGGANGGNGSVIGVGSRPWLQKVAAFTVAISLTIATADTFKFAQEQYLAGYMDADAMRTDIMGSKEIRITRVISDVFIWLAQVQTLIRLFPRHKEKVLIKWIGFALIVLDSTFSCLNSFLVDQPVQPKHFVDAIPALSYLFQLSLGLLYAAWVIYYAFSKRRYAFYHARMRNISLIAALSFVAILTPVVFFITDITDRSVAGWGDYFRWVGATAASVVVWEWVERIEALERDEKKDGILGREIFDGDEMLDLTPAEEVTYNRRRGDNYYARSRRAGGGTGEKDPGAQQSGLAGVAHRLRRARQPPQPPTLHFPLGRAHSHVNDQRAVRLGDPPHRESPNRDNSGITPPLRIVSPPSRTDTNSAASTVYVVRYHQVSDAPEPVRRRPDAAPATETTHNPIAGQQERQNTTAVQDYAPTTRPPEGTIVIPPPKPDEQQAVPSKSNWQSVSNRFKRKRTTPPAEVRAVLNSNTTPKPTSSRSRATPQPPSHSFAKWDVKSYLGAFAAEQGERFRERAAAKRASHVDLPSIVIPAQPRGKTWSPDMLRDTSETNDMSPSRSSGLAQAAQQSRKPSPLAAVGPRVSGASTSDTADSSHTAVASTQPPGSSNSLNSQVVPSLDTRPGPPASDGAFVIDPGTTRHEDPGPRP